MVLQLPKEWLVMGALAYAGTLNAVSLSLESEAVVPTQHFSPPQQEMDGWTGTLDWVTFATAALPDGRPMQDWERQDADEFFWSQFE